MPFLDITNDFKRLLQEKQKDLPGPKRRKVTRQSRQDGNNSEVAMGKEYIAEAYAILKHIRTLTRMLASVRKTYLSIDSRPSPLGRSNVQNIDLNGEEWSWSNVRHLTNEERDQIDLQAKVILTRCSDRIKEMETMEKRRIAFVASKTNPLTRLLPARLRQDELTVASDFLAAHHSSVTWYLSRRLTEASQIQKDMQEERVKRQLERTRTLASGATREAQNMTTGNITEKANDGSSWLGAGPSSLLASTLGISSSQENSQPNYPPAESYASEDEDEDEEIELTSSQILQFESENANILRSVQDTLESVQLAESRLMDISALQMELVTHLSRQTELTDQLYEDAIATTSTVEKGNVQLKEAKRRAKDSRLFILVFLLGASLSLLFLHYY